LPLSGIESRYLGLRSRILITVTTDTPGHRTSDTEHSRSATHRKIKTLIPSLGKIFVLYQGRAQFVGSANRLMLSVTWAVSYRKVDCSDWLCGDVLTTRTSRDHDIVCTVLSHFDVNVTVHR
jgi:hypothetical protein